MLFEEPLTTGECRAYYRNCQKWFDKACEGRGFSFSVKHYLSSDLGSVPSLLSNTDARLHRETLRSAVDVAVGLLAERNIGLIGLVQSGKTPALYTGGLFGSILVYLKTGQFAQPIYLTPNTDTCRCQFTKKSDSIYRCLRRVVVAYGAKKIFVEDYIDKLQVWRRGPMTQAMLDKHSLSNMGRHGRIRNQIDEHLNTRTNLILPMSSVYDGLLEVIVKAFEGNNGRLIFLRDEAHFAIADKSQNDRMFNDNNLYELLNNSQRHQIVLCSATNWVSLHLKKVLLRVSKKYTGLDFAFYEDVDGKEKIMSVTNGVTINEPEISSLGSYAVLTGNEDLAHVRPTWYTDEEVFDRACFEMDLPYSSHEEYRERTEMAIATCINDVFAGKFSSCRQHRGMLVRFANDNRSMDNFISQIRPTLGGDVTIIKAYAGSFTTVDELLMEHRVRENGRYIVFVTARGRMSDSFPKECGYGLDFTYRSDTLGALIQGVLGRMFGYDKDPFILISDKNFERIHKCYIDNGCVGTGKLLNCVSSMGQNPNLHFRLCNLTKNEEMVRWFSEMQEYVDLCVKVGLTKIMKVPVSGHTEEREVLVIGESGMKRSGVHFWNTYIAPRLSYLNKNIVDLAERATTYCRILEPGQSDGVGDRLKMTAFGPCISTRTSGKNFHDHHGGRGRNMGGRKDESNDSGETFIVFRLRADTRGKKTTFTMIGIDLPNNRQSRIGLRNAPNVPSRIFNKGN